MRAVQKTAFLAGLLILLCSLATAQAPTLSVDVTAGRHAISPDVYGISNYNLDTAFAKEIKVPNVRWGGDATTRYNWNVDSSNAGFDFYFVGGSGEATPTPGAGVDTMVSTFAANGGAKSLVTIPIIPYINKSAATTCSFRKSIYGDQQYFNPYVTINGDQCGNSLKPDGVTQIIDTNIGYNHIANSPTIQSNWIKHLVAKFGTAANGGVPYYQLDNEPDGWANTHRDVEPTEPKYSTIVSLGQQYAAAIKAADPSAKVFGPSDFTLGGWVGDTSATGGQNGLFAGQYYLQQMAAYQAAHGTRLIDYFDEHYYGAGSDDASLLASTRSLWDPNYNSGSWVEQYAFLGNMQLIPRFKGWISTYYPGTKLSLSEYSMTSNISNKNDIACGLAHADALGIFGREAVDLANFWETPAPTESIAYAYRLYRNYNGTGGEYGDTWVQSTSSDQTKLSIYGAQRTSDHVVTLVVINKTTAPISTSLSVAHFTATNAHVYMYSSAATAIQRKADVPVTAGSITYTFPAYSATVLELPEVILIGTTTTIGASPSSVPLNQPTSFTATVKGTTGTPTGNVVFKTATKTLGTVALTSGIAKLSNVAITAANGFAQGANTVTASYVGSSTYAATNGTMTLTVTAALPVATAPVISPAGGSFRAAQLVSITDVIAGAAIYYTTDGSLPTTEKAKFGAPFLLKFSAPVKAIATAANHVQSPVTADSFTIIGSPSVLAAPATAITTSGATLNAVVNNLGLSASYQFYYGTSSTAMKNTTAATLAASSAPLLLSAPVSNLATKTTYSFKVVVTTTGGSSSGETLSFITN